MIYAICVALALLALLVSEVTQVYAFIGVFIVSGLVLFGPTRGAFRPPDGARGRVVRPPDEGPPETTTRRRPHARYARATRPARRATATVEVELEATTPYELEGSGEGLIDASGAPRQQGVLRRAVDRC